MARFPFDFGFEAADLDDGIYRRADGLLVVVVGGHQVGLWTKPRWARRDFRYHSRVARKAASR